MNRLRLLLCAACLLAAGRLPGTEELAPVARQEALATAEAYRTFVWTPGARNAFHGPDRAGVRVDTPDAGFRPAVGRPGWWVPGQRNAGVPYQWGGFSSLEEFAAGVAAGRYAGDVYTAAKRAGLDDAVSREAVGIDCSGLISRCWRLPRSYSTRELPALCVRLASYEELKPGDILNTDNQHVLLFQGWRDGSHQRLFAYETGSPPTWKVLLDNIPVTLLRAGNYQPYRYRNIRD